MGRLRDEFYAVLEVYVGCTDLGAAEGVLDKGSRALEEWLD